MSAFKSFLKFLTLASLLMSLCNVGFAARGERDRRPEDFVFRVKETTRNEASEFNIREREKIRELVFFYGYTYEKAENRIRRARKIKRALLALGVFVSVSVIANIALADSNQAPITNPNMLAGAVTNSQTGNITFMANDEALFKVNRNMPRRGRACVSILQNNRYIEHRDFSPN